MPLAHENAHSFFSASTALGDRNGPTQEEIRMHFQREFTRFRDAAHGVDESAVQPTYAQEERL